MLIWIAALYFHGGGYIVGSRKMLSDALIEALNEAGFVAASSDYRLCPTISVLDGPVADSVAAYEWAQDELPVLLEKEYGIRTNGKNIVTLGHSCGGGLALLMVSISRADDDRLIIETSSTTRLLAPTRPRLSLICSVLNISAIPSTTPRATLRPRLARPLRPPPNSSDRSLRRLLRQPLRPLPLVPTDPI